MSTFNKPSQLQMFIAALLFVLPIAAYADADTRLTYGSGPDGYRSYAFKANADLARTVELNLDYFLAKSGTADDMRQGGAGLTWYATKLVSGNYRYSDTDDGIFDVKGNEGGLSIALDTLWKGDLQTSVDLGYGAFKYRPANPRPGVNVDRTLTQNRSNFGLSQDITSLFTVYGSRDQYKYDRNVAGLALLLIRRPRNISQAAFTLLSFPDKTNTLGIILKPTDALSLDLSSAKTTTLLHQEQNSTRLAVDYQIGDSLSIAAAVTRVNLTAIINRFGVTVQPTTQDMYSEFSVGWDF